MLTAFTAGLLLITVSELGDKTFCIAMILAMQYPRRIVFLGVTAALAAMTVLSVLMGQAVSIVPKTYLHVAEVVLFLGFGFKLLFDASRMPSTSICEELDEAKESIEQANLPKPGRKQSNVLLQAFTLTFLAEWGDRTQFATIALAASNNPFGVTAGAVLGHTICAAIAVLSGCLVAGRLSERVITALGGLLFLLFGMIAGIEGV